eukprot:m.179996 g.179996  ORF g.179996 m.179996 type:complete len:415 (-) comp18406_c0_seq1:218-1462(-)
MVLSERQKTDLNAAVYQYLMSVGYEAAASSLQIEADVDVSTKGAESVPLGASILEKKWTAVVRLQKKVMELESKLGDAQAEIAAPVKLGGGKDKTAWIPRPPAKHEVKGHRLAVTRVLFHPVFSVFVSASEDATMKIYDYESGDYERTLKGHTNTVQDMAFDSGGKHMASCSADMTIRLWDFEAFECIKVLRGHDHNVSSVCFTPSGDYIVSASRDKTIRVWEVATGYNTKTLKGHDDWVRRAIVSPDDGKYIASCSNDQTVRLWSLDSGDCIHDLRQHTHVVEAIAWAPSASAAAINALAGTTDSEDPRQGPFFISGARDKTIVLWDAGTGTALHSFTGHDSWVRCLVFHPGGKLILSGADDKTIRVWDIESKRCIKTLPAHNHFVNTIDIHPTAPVFVSGSVDMTSKIWECR